MTLPRELRINTTPKGPRIFQSFTEELTQLRENSQEFDIDNAQRSTELTGISPTRLEVEIEALVGDTGSFYLELTNSLNESYRIGYNADQQAYFSDRTAAGKKSFSEKFAKEIHYAPKQIKGVLVKMHLVFDHGSVEMIADDGMVALTDLFFPNEDFSAIKLVTDNDKFDIQQLSVHTLSSIW